MNKFKGMTAQEKREFLEDYYIKRNLTLREIAIIMGVTAEAVHYWIKKFGLNNTKIV